MPNFLQVLHWQMGFEKEFNVSGVDAVSAELKKTKGQGRSVAVQAPGNVNRVAGSGSVKRAGGSGGTNVVGGKGNVCG